MIALKLKIAEISPTQIQTYIYIYIYILHKKRISYSLFGGKARRKRPLERPRRRWEDGIKMDLGWGVWSGFTWLRTGMVGGLL
jgi:hypothetical protein